VYSKVAVDANQA